MRPSLLLAILTLGLLLACNRAPSTVPAGPPLSEEPVTGIAFVSERDGNWEIYRIQPDGSGLTRLTDDLELDGDPSWSPDGRQIAFRSRRDGSSDIFLMGADGANPTNLLRDPRDSADDEFSPRYYPDGETLILYTDRQEGFTIEPCIGHHMAQVPLAGGSENLRPVVGLRGTQETFAWSPDGNYLAFSSRGCNEQNAQLLLLERESGQIRRLTEDDSANSQPAWSHDSRFLAFQSNRDGNLEVYLLDLDTDALTNLTNHPADDNYPAWSPDDSRIAFTTNRDGNSEIYVMDRDGSNPHNLTSHPARDFWPAWSPVPAP
jgi:Tol biopolymer transport system component